MSYPKAIPHFEYKGFHFTLDEYTYPLTNSAEKATERFKQDFDYSGEEIVSMENGEIVVDWKRYFIQDRTHRGEDGLNIYIKILLALGILSFQKEDNWAVVSYGMFVNPRTGMISRFFFTRKQDAIEYAMVSGWLISEVFQYGEIVSGQELKQELKEA